MREGQTSSSVKDRVRKQVEERMRTSTGGGTLLIPDEREFFTPKVSTRDEQTFIDIIPYVVTVDNHKWVGKGDYWYEHAYLRHRYIGVDSKSYICPKSVGKKCPICEHRAELKRGGADEKVLSALNAQEAQIFNVVDLHDLAKGIQIWDFPYTRFGEKLYQELNFQSETEGFFLPDEGFSLRIRFLQKSFDGHPFTQADNISFVERKPVEDKYMKKALDLDKLLHILSYDELKKIYYGEEEQASMPVPTSRQPKDFPVDEPAPERSAPVRRRAAAEPAPVSTAKEEKNPCPCGHRWGEDVDSTEDCEKCDDEWQGCYDEKQRRLKENRRRS